MKTVVLLQPFMFSFLIARLRTGLQGSEKPRTMQGWLELEIQLPPQTSALVVE